MDFTNLIHLSHQAVTLSDDSNWGTEEQIDAENAFFNEARIVATKMDIADAFENHCENLHKATAEELIVFTMGFFLNQGEK